MRAGAQGDLDNPGKNVKAKSGLNKSIVDQGWGEFSRQLEYKQIWRGGEVLYVNPKYTSQTCPQCAYFCKENRNTQMHFECQKYSYRAHTDFVASINIARAGHARLACRDIAAITLQAQEPLAALS